MPVLILMACSLSVLTSVMNCREWRHSLYVVHTNDVHKMCLIWQARYTAGRRVDAVHPTDKAASSGMSAVHRQDLVVGVVHVEHSC